MTWQESHGQSLETSTALSAYYVQGFIPPLDVIDILNRAGVRFVLVGVYGIGGWIDKPRATQAVEAVVSARSHKKAIDSLTAAFLHVEARDGVGVTNLLDRASQRAIVRLLRPCPPFDRAVFRYACTVRSGGHRYKIPTRELAIALAYAQMSTLTWADPDKYLRAHDFILMVKGNPDIDLDKLAKLGNLVYPDGGKELVEKVRQVRAGEKLQL